MIFIRSRHPSHKPLRKARIKSNWKRIIYRLGSLYNGKQDGEINSVQSIKNSSSKVLMKTAFLQKDVKSTLFWIKPEDIPQDIKFPLLAKKKFGSRGKGMVKIDSSEALKEFIKNKYNNTYYFEKYFSGAKEYRVHYSKQYGPFYCCRKLRKNDAKDRWYFNSNNCVWINEYEIIRHNGKFVSFNTHKPQALFDKPKIWNEILEHCKLAMEATNLDIAAIDVRVNSKGDNFVILETNSAPGLGEIGTVVYLNLLKQIGKNA